MNKFLMSISTISQHEWAMKRRSGVLSLLFILMQVLLMLALLTGWSQHQNTLAHQSSAQAMVEQQWNAQPDRHPHRVAHFGHFTFRPPSALGFFDQGVDHFVGNSIFIEAHRQNSANFANDQDSDSLLRFSELSVANLLLLLWPLLLIVLGYNSIAAERQVGTLRQLLSIDIHFSQLLLGKGLCYALISLLFIAPVFIATLMLLSSSDMVITNDSYWRIGGLLALYLGYCLVWIGLILLVSSIVSAPRQTLTLLVSIWFGLSILMPRLLADIAANQYPQQSRNAFDRAIKVEVNQVGDSHNPNDPHFNAFKAKTLAEYGVSTVDELPVNYKALVIQEGERISSKIFTKHYRQQMAQQQKQQQLISQFYSLNPYLLARDLSMAIAGSDVWHFYHYEQQSEAHRFARIEKLNTIHAEHIDTATDSESTADQSLWQQFNAFEYHGPNLTQSLAPYPNFWLRAGLLLMIVGLLVSNNRIKRRVYALA
jgi:ABC-2 type transport system permease protein